MKCFFTASHGLGVLEFPKKSRNNKSRKHIHLYIINCWSRLILRWCPSVQLRLQFPDRCSKHVIFVFPLLHPLEAGWKITEWKIMQDVTIWSLIFSSHRSHPEVAHAPYVPHGLLPQHRIRNILYTLCPQYHLLPTTVIQKKDINDLVMSDIWMWYIVA